MDLFSNETIAHQLDKLERILNVNATPINLIEKAALGMLCDKVQHIWSRSGEPLNAAPSPALQDALSLFAQHTWQRWREDAILSECISDSTEAFHQGDGEYHWDIDLHRQYPELSLIKYWSASVSASYATPLVDQATLWCKHLYLTQSMLLAQQQKILNPHCLIGYGEKQVILIDMIRRQVVVASDAPFNTFRLYGLTFYYVAYPK